MPINDDFKHQVKSANPLESIVSNYASLKKSGRNYVCCCPFHSEKTPSFHINVEDGFYKCFGCGESGDVFSFIMKIENLSFMEALKFLAERSGIPVPKWEKTSNSDKNSKERSLILDINREAARFYFNQLGTSRNVISYIKHIRNISAEVALKTYGMGYAPNDWFALTKHLRSLGFNDNDIVKSGLARVGKSGTLVDFFVNRLIVPIMDIRGNIIAFGGRTLDDSNKNIPKYLNSPDTPVFKKSENLFSLNLAKKNVGSSKTILLAEGYMDVIALYQAGFTNAVASLGTSLTPEQVNIIRRYADEVIICYDNDTAGINATNRAISLLLNASNDKDLKIKVLKINNAKDPDEYIKNYGADRFKLLLETSLDAIDFQLEQVRNTLNLHTNSGKIELLKHSANILAQISNNSIREVYVSSVANECNIESSTFSEMVNKLINKNNNLPIKKNYHNNKNIYQQDRVNINNIDLNANNTLVTINHKDERSRAKTYNAERWIIAYICTIYDLIPYARESLQEFDFEFNSHKSIFKTICEHADNLNQLNDISIVHSDLTEEYFNSLLDIYNNKKEIIADIGLDNAQQGLFECIDKIKEPKITIVDGKIDLLQLKNKKLQEERLKHKNIT